MSLGISLGIVGSDIIVVVVEGRRRGGSLGCFRIGGGFYRME